MIGFDRIVCDYPLSNPMDQDREFVTRDLGGWGRQRYTITRDGRLIRNAPARRDGLGPVRDVEWPVEGEIRNVMGRPASPEEFLSMIPGKLELVDGHIPGEEKLVLLLLATMGLRRVAALVGRTGWLSAVDDRH